MSFPIDVLLIVPIAISFLIAFLLMPFWIKKAKALGLEWKDMNKASNRRISGSGGIVAVLAFIIGILLYVAYRTFILETDNFLVEILALISVILFVASVGFFDDLIGWRKGGLRRRYRLILAALGAIPLIVINAGKSVVGVPYYGTMDIGLLFPLIVVPIGIVGATYTYNFLAGFNGLEAGQGILIMIGISIVAFFTGSSWLSVIALIMLASLAGFIFYNFYPATVFPGDSITYAIGALLATIAILGNFELVAVFFFIPYIIEVFLKIRGGLIKHSFGKPMLDGTLNLRYDKIYSLNHLSIWLMQKTGIKPTEKKVVYSIWLFQAIVIALGLIVFRQGIFQ